MLLGDPSNVNKFGLNKTNRLMFILLVDSGKISVPCIHQNENVCQTMPH